MTTRILKRLGVTAGFLLAAFVYAITIWGLSLAGYEIVPGRGLGHWSEQVGLFVGYAAFAGLMVDFCRAALSALWQLIGLPKRRRNPYTSESFA